MMVIKKRQVNHPVCDLLYGIVFVVKTANSWLSVYTSLRYLILDQE